MVGGRAGVNARAEVARLLSLAGEDRRIALGFLRLGLVTDSDAMVRTALGGLLRARYVRLRGEEGYGT